MRKKLCFSTLGCPGWSFERIVDTAQRMGFGAVELRGVGEELCNDRIPELWEENLPSTLRRLRRAGAALAGLGTSCRFDSQAARREAMEEGRRAVEICRAAGIPFVRVFGDQLPGSPAERPAALHRVADGIGSLCAAAGDVAVLLEVHGDFNAIEALEPVLKRLGGLPQFGLLWDVEHSDAVYGAGWEAFYERIRPWVRHVHLKDHRRLPDGGAELCLPGEGDLPLADIVRRLLRDGYEGWLSLEWEKRWQPQLPDMEAAMEAFLTLMRGI